MAATSLILLGAPKPLVSGGGSSGFANFTIDDATEKVAIAIQALEAATITKLSFRHAALTGTPPTYRISLQSVNTSGNPSGTVLGGGSPASVTFTPTGGGGYGSGTIHRLTLSNSYACTRGELFAIVIEYSSGTVDGSNNSSFTYGWSLDSPRAGFPNAQLYTASAWAKQTDRNPCMAYESASTVYGTLLTAADTSNGFSQTAEVGVYFTLPAGWGQTFQLAGCIPLLGVSAGLTMTATLYSNPAGTPTVLQQVTLDTDLLAATTWRLATFLFDEVTLSTLDLGTAYAIGFSASASGCVLRGQTVNAVGDWASVYGGQLFAHCSRTITEYPTAGADGAFSLTTTKRPYCDLVLSDLTEPTGGGGPLMRGRLIG